MSYRDIEKSVEVIKERIGTIEESASDMDGELYDAKKRVAELEIENEELKAKLPQENNG